MPYTGGYPRAVDLQIVRGQYDFAVDGGAQGSIDLSNIDLPADAVVLGGWLEVITAPTGAGASIGLQVEAADDIVADAAISGAPWSTLGLKSIIPVFTGATAVKTTQARTPQAVIASADLTAGKFDLVLMYVQVPD